MLDRNQIFVAPASRRRFCEMWSTEESLARCRRAAFDPNVKDNTAEGVAMRVRMAALFDVEQRKVTVILGIEAGYRYVDSPIIWRKPRR